MNNTKRYWKLDNYTDIRQSDGTFTPDGTYDLCLDSWWIEVNDPLSGRITHKVSPSGKTIYSLGYANYCLEYYRSMYGADYGFAKVWIEPCYQVVSRNVPYTV